MSRKWPPWGTNSSLTTWPSCRSNLPAKGKIRLIKDGELFREEVGRELTCGIDETGLYRVEVYLWRAFKYRPWIFSNPIYVR